jgi:hypothetical protein
MSSEARGIDPEPIGIQSWPTTLATALPGNINDEDIGESSREEKGSARFTDMTMSLVRYRLSLGLRELVTAPVPPAGSEAIQKSLDGTVEVIERQYLKLCHANDPIQRVTLELGRLGEYKLRLLVYHQFMRERNGAANSRYWGPARKKYVNTTASPPSHSVCILIRNRAMEYAKDLISSYQTLLSDVGMGRFHWHIKRHSQLHGMLHIINELSKVDTYNLSSDIQLLCKQAWETIADVEMDCSNPGEGNNEEERLWTFLHNLREQVRLRLYTQGFISRGFSTNFVWEAEYNSPVGGIDGTNLLESLFGGPLGSFGFSGNGGMDF